MRRFNFTDFNDIKTLIVREEWCCLIFFQGQDMFVEILTPDDYLGDVMGDVSGRRGKVTSLESRMGTQIIRAHVPLSSMFGYATDLRSKTQGRATYSMLFDHYEKVPVSVAEELLKKI